MLKLLPASLALALAAPMTVRADTNSDISALRQEIAAMRSAYEASLAALEQRLKAAEAAATTPAPPAPAASPTAGPSTAANAFNPAISLILSGLYGRTSQDPAQYAMRGFQLPKDAELGPGTRGFSLAESELGLSANIDPWLRGAANIALHGDNSLSVEEAYVQTTALGHGLAFKAGRFFSGVGYLNSQHAHAWDFVDNPLAYQAMLGTQYGDDGVQLNWLAPTEQYLELGLELGRGRSFPGGDNSRNGAGMSALTAHTGGDIGASHSWRFGVSVLNAKADEQALQGQGANGSMVNSLFSGSTRVWVLDAIWKWAPEGNATRTSFKLQGEWLRSRRSGSLVVDPGQGDSAGAYRATQSGWYVQGVYQFMPGWRLGLRSERLQAGTPDYGINAGLYAQSDYRPRKDSLMLDFNASEFSRVRLQLAHDRARDGSADRQLFLQYQMSLGAHGAHGY
ncbi:porin [Paucibacter soli]|uniref:porin n=1 Tax=Paucibacter soli TaxID=3133433 RepID=UPI0030B0FB67